MRAHRLILPEAAERERLSLDAVDARHVRVLRLRAGDAVRVCDGAGREWEGRLEPEGRGWAVVRGGVLRSEVPPRPHVTLFQGWARGDKMEWILQKAVELGVMDFVPLLTTRTPFRPDRDAPRLPRWREIARQAARQSERTHLARVHPPATFAEALAAAETMDAALLPYEDASDADRLHAGGGPPPERLGVFIGPEGGFESREAAAAAERGVRRIWLGPRILRTETAGIAMLTLVQYLWGDLGGQAT